MCEVANMGKSSLFDYNVLIDIASVGCIDEHHLDRLFEIPSIN